MANFNEEWVVGPENTKFYTRSYDAKPESATPKALVVWVHGFQEHIARYDHVFNLWASKGIAVSSFDQRGWGRTVEDATERSKDSAYGRTSRPQQIRDLDFFLKRAIASVPEGTPVFLCGHSMGGALVLSFITQPPTNPTASALSRLAGVVVTSPLIRQTHPANGILRKFGAIAARLFPNLNYPVKVPADDLTSDPEFNSKAAMDPMMKTFATMGVLNDILTAGETLVDAGFKAWPANLPLLMVHGDKDNVCCFNSSRSFFDNLKADDKSFIPYEGGCHELHNEPHIWERQQADILGWVEKHLQGAQAKL
ncbi:hypothetical protein FRC03_011675 [Tulasnella sp. 419]|nr:hypothetical protein FRC02_009780 [Tulasnella sp. 418]KAG8953761.1 hypothetical protein FRC03_011675 [Tulasnella sp. 419]